MLVLARDQFIDALPDEDMCLRIRQSSRPPLQQALETALELESYSMVSKRARPVRKVHRERGDGSKGAKSHTGTDIVQLERNVQQGARRGKNRRSTRRGTLMGLLEKMGAGNVDNLVTFRGTALMLPPHLKKQLLPLQELPPLRIRETSNS